MNPGMDIDAGPGAPPSEYDALADLFLADEATSRTSVPKQTAPAPRLVRDDGPVAAHSSPTMSAASAHIEGVLVGHLPVLASAWLTQYARYQADTMREPVALLRVLGDQTLLDVVMPGGTRPPQGWAAKPGESLQQVVQRSAAAWRHWLVRVDQAHEAELLALDCLSSVVLLTGADDAAVVASYQMLKSLGSATAPQARAAPLRLVIMGAADARANEAEESLRAAASTFLDRTIDSTVKVGKIGSSMAVQVYRGPVEVGTPELLGMVVSEKRAPQRAARPFVAPTAPAIPLVPKIEVPRIAPGSIAPRPSPRIPSEKPAASVNLEPSFTGFAGQIPGLRALGLRCPYAAGVELATAPDSRLHLVAGSDANGQTVSGAAQGLLTAAAWANDHAPLLQAAYPALKSLDAVLHVVTTNAKEARGLLDTGMRVHLLTRVVVNGAVAWAVADLN